MCCSGQSLELVIDHTARKSFFSNEQVTTVVPCLSLSTDYRHIVLRFLQTDRRLVCWVLLPLEMHCDFPCRL